MYCSVEEEPRNTVIASNCLLRVRSGICITVIYTFFLVRDDQTMYCFGITIWSQNWVLLCSFTESGTLIAEVNEHVQLTSRHFDRINGLYLNPFFVARNSFDAASKPTPKLWRTQELSGASTSKSRPPPVTWCVDGFIHQLILHLQVPGQLLF
jgi:hypothetical protein